jgi:bifunctional UDP-N-acetylglucosamine pyrophosphorylase/glucosamine-1-phosphate N-acetyltransferase
MDDTLHVLILAAGKGTRMRSALPKVLHAVCELPMLEWVMLAAESLRPASVTTVVGAGADAVRAAFAGRSDWAEQAPPLGSGHAAAQALPALEGLAGDLLVLMGDVPLLTAATLRRLVDAHRAARPAATVLTAAPADPAAYGRVLRAADGRVTAIREARDASPAELAVGEINTGIYIFGLDALRPRLARLRPDNDQGEYYLTDVVALLHADGLRVDGLLAADPAEAMGINHRADLAAAEAVLQARIVRHWMLAGVTVRRPERVWIGPHARLEPDTTLWWDVTLAGATHVGPRCEIGPGAHLENARLGAGVRVEYSVVRDAEVADGTAVGPYAHVRGGARIGPGNRIGNFVEVKKSTTGPGTKAAHLAYLGDATLGAGVNVGAGTITCNYDGVHKHPTVIGDGAFIGSDSILVAPLTVGAGAYTAAGSTVTTDVPPDALAVGRARQRNLPGWAAKRRAQLEGEGSALEPEGEKK